MINSELSFEWIKAFDKATHPKLNFPGEWHQLAINSHCTHLTGDFLEYARDQNIDITGYILHPTHILQGLDAVCFSPFKTYITQMKKEHQRTTGSCMSKAMMMKKLKGPFDKAFCAENIREAFCATGLEPINESIISADAVAPSASTTTNATFGLQQPAEVQALIPLLKHVQQKQSTRTYNRHMCSIPHTPTLHSTPEKQKRTILPGKLVIDPLLLTPCTCELADTSTQRDFKAQIKHTCFQAKYFTLSLHAQFADTCHSLHQRHTSFTPRGTQPPTSQTSNH
jgi:hypothetical protein